MEIVEAIVISEAGESRQWASYANEGFATARAASAEMA